MRYSADELTAAHKDSRFNKKGIESSTMCGCFYCAEIYPSTFVGEYIEAEPDTALCPYCGLDSVLFDTTERPVTKELLAAMRDYWF